MPAGIAYLDASALVKLALPEAETRELLRFVGEWPERVTSALAAVEVVRAVRRSSRETLARHRAEQVLAAVYLLAVDDPLLDRAAHLEPATLRTLDALHLASALALGDDLGSFVVYDERLAAAARTFGLPVASPGA